MTRIVSITNKKGLLVFMLMVFTFMNSIGQVKPIPARVVRTIQTAPKLSAEKLLIDSLSSSLEGLKIKCDVTDSLLDAERSTSSDLREQVIKLDDYRKKLEGNIGSYKGENLKLNQSNRILIAFNSLVAILLVISLVFFLKKIGNRKTTQAKNTSGNIEDSIIGKEPNLSLEDKLQQLERLGKLREKGLLSENEFLAEKQKVLGK